MQNQMKIRHTKCKFNVWKLQSECKVKVMSGAKKPRKCRVTYFEPKYLNIANKIEGIYRGICLIG